MNSFDFMYKKYQQLSKSEKVSYRNFYQNCENIDLRLIAVVTIALEIGVDYDSLEMLIVDEPSSQNNKKAIDNLIAKIDLMVDDKKFKDVINSKILFIINNGKYLITNNSFSGITEEENVHLFELVIEKDKVRYNHVSNNVLQYGLFTKTPMGNKFITEISKVGSLTPNCFEKKSKDIWDFQNIYTKTKIRTFDEQGYQKYDYKEEQRENFYINRKTKALVLNSPTNLENYTEKIYMWKDSKDNIIKRVVQEYASPNNLECFIPPCNNDVYFIGKNEAKENKTIDCLEFESIPKTLVKTYRKR